MRRKQHGKKGHNYKFESSTKFDRQTTRSFTRRSSVIARKMQPLQNTLGLRVSDVSAPVVVAQATLLILEAHSSQKKLVKIHTSTLQTTLAAPFGAD